MPKVPKLQQQVAPQGLPGPRFGPAAPPEAYGAGVGETIRQAGAELYRQEIYYQDRAAVTEAESFTNQAQIEIMEQMSQLRGKEAARSTDFALGEFDKRSADIRSKLSSERQRYYYDAVAQRTRDSLHRSSLTHFHRENEAFLNNTFQGFMEQSLNVARASAEDPATVAFQRMERENKIRERAERLGYAGTDQETGEIVASNSTIHKEVIGAMLAKGNDLAARDYYNKVKQKEDQGYVIGNQTIKPGLQFTAQDRDVIEKLVLEGSTRGESRREAQRLIDTHGIQTVDQRRAVLEAIKGIENDKVADLVRQRVEHEFSAFDQLNKAQAEQNFMNASKMIDETWTSTKGPARDMIPVPLWNSFTPGEQHTLELKLDRLRTPMASHDPEAWYRFKTMLDTDLAKMTPAQLMKEYLVKFDKDHYDRALNEYNAAINAKMVTKKPAEEKMMSALTTRDRIRNKFNLSGIAKDVKKLTTEEAIWFDRFEGAADKALSQLPKDATPDEIDKVLTSISDAVLKQKVVVDPGFLRFKKEVPVIGAEDYPDARSIRVPLKEIPADRQDVLRGALRQAGVPITNQAIEELEAKYRLRKGQ